MKLRQLFEAKETVGIIFGRFNPPHQGHKAAWEEAAKNTYWYVGTNKSTIGPKDPLPFDVKIQAMETIWPSIKGHIIPEQTWWSLAAAVYKKHGEIDLKVITDENDAKVFVPGLQKSNGVESKHGYYKFKSIEWQQAPRVSSATELRAAVANDDPKAFAKAAGVPADTKVAGEPFFDLVKHYLGQQNKNESLDEAQIGDVIPFKKSNPANPHLDKDALDTWNKERNQKMAQDMIRLAPEIVEYYKELKDQNKDTETAIDIIAYDFDIDQYDVKRILQADNVDEDLEEAQTGDVYMRFKVKPPLDKNRSKPTLMAFAGFANTPGELTLDTAKMNFNVLTKKQDIVNAVKKVIGDKIFIGAEKVVVYNDGAVNPKKFPQYNEFLDWIKKFGKEKVQVVDKPDSDDTGEKGPGKKRVKAKWANKKNYTDDNIETTKYFTIDNNRLMKFLQKSAPKIMQAYRPASKQFVMEPAEYKTFRNWMRSPDVVSKFGDTNVKVDKSKSFSQSVGKEFEQIEEAPGEEDGVDGVTGQTVRGMARLKARYPNAESDLELMLAAIIDNKNLIKATDFDNDEEADDLAARLDKIEKTVKNIKSKKESVKEADKVTSEKAPPGREKQVKALKKKFDDPGAPYAIAWAQHNKKKK